MNIAISTSPLSTGHSARGTGVYTKNLVDALSTYGKEHTYSFFTHERDIPETADLVHYPYFDPFFLTLPMRKLKPTVVTVHDVIPLVFPEHFPPGLRGSLKWQLQRLSLQGSARIITDSQKSKEDISRIVRYEINLIDVVPLASSIQPVLVNRNSVEQIRTHYHIPKSYFLYVGDVNWNKNVLGLLEAWAAFVKTQKNPVSLVLGGSVFVKPELLETQEILSYISEHSLEDSVIRPGFIKDEDLAYLYQGAISLVVPSWYEGFGLPVLEAFAAGVPVIATNRGSVPEISGPSFVFDPGSPNELVYAMKSVVGLTEKERKVRIAKGTSWVKNYTWEKTARLTIQSYEKALNYHSNI